MRVVDEEAVTAALRALPGDAPRVVVGGNAGTPRRLLALLDATRERCRAFVLNPAGEWPARDGFVVETPFVGPGCRRGQHVDYLPMRLSLVPVALAGPRPPDALLVQTTPPRDGRVSLGVEVNVLPAALDAVRRRGGLVVAQLNRAMPWTSGDAELDTDLVDLALECDEPLLTLARPEPDAVAEALAEHVVARCVDGATLQCGIGNVPDAITARLRGAQGLGIWSEVVSDGVIALERSGAIAADRPLVASFVLGSDELYDWARGHPRLRLTRTETVNDPAHIARQHAMLSINAALEVDLFDQVNATFVGDRVYSGFGGQTDFVVGALHAPGGVAVVALRSWHERSGRSTIVPRLEVPATSFQHSAIATEHGLAELFGRTQREQAEALVAVADPRAREGLAVAARTSR